MGELKKDPSYYEKHKILLVKALKWQGQNENPSLLLRGYNLQQFEAWLKVAKQNKDYPPLPLQEEFITASLNKTEESSLEVFISYSRSDSDLARKINEQLQELGKTTWFDQESIATGTDFKKEIERGIESSDNFLFIISPKSVNSPYCADEVEYAQQLNKRFVTILHRPLSEEDKRKQPSALASVQYLDFNQHGGDFGANFYELVRTLNTDRDHVRNHTEWSQKALKWQQRSQDEALLLRGSELVIAENWLSEAEKNNQKPPTTKLQKEFIGASGELRDCQQKEKENQQKAELERQKRDKRMAQGIAVGSVGALVISSGLGLMAWQKTRQAEFNQAESLARYSLSLGTNGSKDLDAFVSAIKAGNILRAQKTTNPEVIKALQEALVHKVEQNRLLGHQRLVENVALSSDGKTLVSGSNDKTIKVWDLATGKELRTLTCHQDSVNSIALSSDGQTLVSGSYDETIKVWDLATGGEPRTLNNQSAVNSVALSSDGQTLVSGSLVNTIKVWDLATEKEPHSPAVHQGRSDLVALSSDGQTLVYGSFGASIKVWNLAKGKELRTLNGHQSAVSSVALSSDGKTLVSGSKDKTIKVWDLAKGGEPLTLNGHQGLVNSVALSSDSKTLVSASEDKTIKVWDLATGKERRTLTVYPGAVNRGALSSDGNTFVSGLGTGIKVWNLAQGGEPRTLTGHQGLVLSVALSSDGKTLVSGSYDKTIKVWDLATGKELRTLNGHQDAVMSVALSSDGKTLVSGSADKTIKVWDFGVDSLMAKSCDWVRVYLKNPNSDVKKEDRQLCDGIGTKQ